MSELLVLGLKIAFLALLWLFILFAGNVIRTDLFGRKVAVPAQPAPLAPSAPANSPAQPAPVPVPAAPPQRDRLSGRAARKAKKLPQQLRITQGPQTGLTMALGDSLLIGRTPDSRLVLDDQFMSTRHALITRTLAGYVVEDLGSTNGTYLNETRITAPTPFTPADTLRIGRTQLVVER